MSFVQVLRCVKCSKEYDPRHIINRCDQCGEILDVIYDYSSLKIDREEIRRRSGGPIQKYHEFLPVFDTNKVPSLGEGGTP